MVDRIRPSMVPWRLVTAATRDSRLRSAPVNEDHPQHLAEEAQHNQDAQHCCQATRTRWDGLVQRHAAQPRNPWCVDAALEDTKLWQLPSIEHSIARIAARPRQHVRQ